MHHASTRRWATDALFGAFILALFGWGLLHACAARAGAAAALHALIAVPGLVSCAIVLYRYARHWPARTALLYRDKRRGLYPGTAAAAGAELLFVAGGGLALALSVDSVPQLALSGLTLAVLPWTRLPVCRDHFFMSAAAVGAGAVLGFAVDGDPFAQPYHALGALFCLCLAAAMTMFVVLLHGRGRDRTPAAGFGWTSD